MTFEKESQNANAASNMNIVTLQAVLMQ